MNRILLAFFLYFTLLYQQASGQGQGEVFIPDTSWSVMGFNGEKSLAFSGGFNNPQFSLADLNNDGKPDLVVFEKGSVQIKTFINYGSSGNPDYRYRPEYEKTFPEKNGIRDISGYMKMMDLNCDQVPDVLTRGVAGMAVYYGYYQNNKLHFNFYKELFYSPLTEEAQGFEGTAFPPSGWNMKNTGWSRQTAGSNPTVSPKDGSAMLMFNAHDLPPGSTALLFSKRLRVSPNLGKNGRLSFWIYRDNQSQAADSVSVYINTDTTLTNAVYMGHVARCRTINQPDTKPSDGWYLYQMNFPASFSGNNAYLIFKGTGRGGNNIFLEQISWISSKPSGDVNAYVDPGGDIPGAIDVDGDGDIDFFSFNLTGGYVNFYKNYQKEENLPCDSIRINLKDACWGKFYQGFVMEQTLGVSCPSFQPPTPPYKITHTGNTICMLDIDGDGDIDMLNGGVSYPNIQLLINGKADNNYPIDTIIAQDTTWPSNGHPYFAHQFPSAFHIDIDQDGKKDILISPTAEGASENYHCVAFYKNTGTALQPAFTYQGDSFLVNRTMDNGTGSYPMIFDYNKDGKPDLFVGSDGLFQQDGSLKAAIAWYENTSSGGNLSFTLQSRDFLSFGLTQDKGAYPAAGDLDNDGKEDLVIGHSDGTLSFYKNMASSSGVQPQWELAEAVLKDHTGAPVNTGSMAAPFIYDMNLDGKPDLIVGSFSGWVYYYENTGSTGQLSLELKSNKLGMAKADPESNFANYAVPFVGKMDNTGVPFLVLGSNSGKLSRYKGFENGNVSTPYTIVDSFYSFINKNLGLYSGFRSAPAVADLDGDGKYEMILGNQLGGLRIYKQNLTVSNVSDIAGSSEPVTIYPNPASREVYISWEKDFGRNKPVRITLSGLSGQKVFSVLVSKNQVSATIEISHLPDGFYLCEVFNGREKSVSKLVVLRN